MANIRPIFVAVCLVFSQVTCTMGYFCNRLAIQQCLRPFHGYSKQLKAVFPEHDDEYMELICRKFELMKECVLPMRPTCDIVTRKSFDGVLEAFSFICEEGLEGYKKHEECLGSYNVQREGETCTTTYETAIESAPYTSSSLDDVYDTMCDLTKEYLDCIYHTVKTHCGKAAADWQHEVTVKTVKPVLEELDCKLEDKCKLGGGALAALVICCSIVVITVCVGCYVRSMKRRKRMQAKEVCTPPTTEGAAGIIIPAITATVYHGQVYEPPGQPLSAPPYVEYYAPPPYTAAEADQEKKVNPDNTAIKY